DTFREARQLLETFQQCAPSPYVIAANKQDCPDAWSPEELRLALRLEAAAKVIPCVALDRQSVKNVLLELLYLILDRAEE
ncbi:MAG: GTP-binding protein, partial [Chloroflexota bacterium]